MEFFGLSFAELVVIFVVAILVFGQRLPQVAGETAATFQRVKRSLSDLRRETGIDQEIHKAKREFEEAQRVARDSVQRELAMARAAMESEKAPASSAPPSAASAASGTSAAPLAEGTATAAEPQAPPASESSPRRD